MNESLLPRFIDLVKHDQQINAVERDIDKFRDDVDKHEKDIQTIKKNLDVTERHKRDMRKFVDEKELHMKELDEQEREAKRRLDKAKNNREFKVLQRGVISLQQKQNVFEQELLETWKQYEEAQRIYAEKKEQTNESIKKFNALIYEKMQKIKELEDQAKNLYNDRLDKTDGISDEMLEKYSLMRKQITNPVVPVDRGSCTACFYTIPQQEIISIQRGALKQCKMCFRFLYSEAKNE